MSQHDAVMRNTRVSGSGSTPHAAGFASANTAALKAQVARLSARIETLEREQAELQDFTAMAAHEMIKPLVLTEARALEVLDRSSARLDIVSQQDLEQMVRSSARVRMVVEALLTDLRHDGPQLSRELVDMTSVVKNCVDLLDVEIEAKHTRVQVDPMPMVAGNAALLNGAMGNLLANAVKYGPRSGGEIRISVEREASGWVFSVSSSGRPIPERDRARIFDPWRRGHGERRSRGAGLGLAIVRRIAERHGGEVGVAVANGWNRFYFTLPT